MFGRAALLGYNARGDPRSCQTAYPTCPRDSDQLINYLNNHNGGFFRFFNQQLPQFAPQYAHHYQTVDPQRPPPYYPGPPYAHRRPPPYRYSVQEQQEQQQQYAAGFQRPDQYFANRDSRYTTRSDRSLEDDRYSLPKPRILSGTPAQYYDVPSVQDLALQAPLVRPPMTFPSEDHAGGAANSVTHFAFPSDHDGGHRRPKNIKMVFPDRTGTGGLRADLDKYGNYKGVYYADGAIKFVDKNVGADLGTDDDDDGPPSKIEIPSQWSWPASSRPGKAAGEFHVPGNRLPYHKRSDFKFPGAP